MGLAARGRQLAESAGGRPKGVFPRFLPVSIECRLSCSAAKPAPRPRSEGRTPQPAGAGTKADCEQPWNKRNTRRSDANRV